MEFSAGGIPGFVHLYAGEEASAVGVCMHLDRPRQHRQHPSRPRPLHRQGLRRDGMMGEIFGRKDGAVRRQGRLDAHRRPRQGHDGRERHRRRRSAADLRRRADREDAARPAAWRWRSSATAAPTRAPRSSPTTSPRSGICRRSSSSRTTATPKPPRRAGRSPAASSKRARVRHARASRWTGTISSPSTKPAPKRIDARRAGEGPTLIHVSSTATTAISRATR